MNWYLYIVECSDGSLYTGITTDLVRRIKEHNNDNAKGAKSLRGKRPVKLVYHEEYKTKSEVSKRESAIKKWDRSYKLKLIEKSKLQLSRFTV
jgi:putative endonuclease